MPVASPNERKSSEVEAEAAEVPSGGGSRRR
jgi:hypothetical protein